MRHMPETHTAETKAKMAASRAAWWKSAANRSAYSVSRTPFLRELAARQRDMVRSPISDAHRTAMRQAQQRRRQREREASA